MNNNNGDQMDLGEIDKAWRGFTLTRGQLFTPGGTPYKPGEVEAIPIRRQQIAHYKRELATPKQWLL